MNPAVASTESLAVANRLWPECKPESASESANVQRQQVAEDHLQEVVARIEKLPDPHARELAQECVRLLLDVYGRCLGRVLQLVQDHGERSQPLLETLLRDQLVRSLLLVHGLHPVSLEMRLQEALEKVRPYMQSHGGNVQLISLEGEVARLRFNGTCQSCPSSAVTMELAIRRAVEEACPDLLGLELDSAPVHK